MEQLLRCVQGHQWEVPADATILMAGPVRCPVCGSPEASLADESSATALNSPDNGVAASESTQPEGTMPPANGPALESTIAEESESSAPPDATIGDGEGPLRAPAHLEATIPGEDEPPAPSADASGATQADAPASAPEAILATQTELSAAPAFDADIVTQPEGTVSPTVAASGSEAERLEPGASASLATQAESSASPPPTGTEFTAEFLTGAGAGAGASGLERTVEEGRSGASASRRNPQFTVPQGVSPTEGEDEPSEGTQPYPGKSRTRGAAQPAGRASAAEFPFEIIGTLGRGGMGVVYKARQTRLHRIVALKMILAGADASERELARFRIEAEAVAGIQHPNIVQIYEIGEHEGRPYFSLEYVDGGTLNQRAAHKPFTFREAAQLVQLLAEGMYHAHQRGIIHRDLKPANVLLTEDGQPKITDFGLAKRFQEDTGQTRTGAVMGTPSYMAPEQAQGKTKELGPPADIYSLGAILYDLLTGRPPFRGETVLDTLMQVKTAEPVAPSRIQEKVPRDLETICLKCLRKEPAKRYATAGALAEDLRRYLHNEPITARPVPWWERAYKWAYREPAYAALAAAGVVFLIFLLGAGFVYGGIQKKHAEDEARHAGEETELKNQALKARDDAAQQRDRAEDNFETAQKAVEEMLTTVGEKTLAHEPRMERARRRLLQKALLFYEKFLTQKVGDVGVRHQTARALLRVGDIQEMLGQHDKAEDAYQRAISMFEALIKEFPGKPIYQEDLAVNHNNLGVLQREQGRNTAAEKSFGKARDAYQKLVQHSADPGYQQKLASAYHNLGLAQRTLGHATDADTAYREALNLERRLVKNYQGQPLYERELARTLDNQGDLFQATGLQSKTRLEEARRSFLQAQELLTDLVGRDSAAPEDRQELALNYQHLGNLLRDLDPPKAGDAYAQAVPLLDRLVYDFPTVPAYRLQLAAVYNDRAILHQAAGRREQADKDYSEAVRIKKQLAQDFPRVPDYREEVARSYNSQGILLQSQNRIPDAKAAYQEAIHGFRLLADEFKNNPTYRQELAQAMLNLAPLFQATNQFDEARSLYTQGLDLEAKLADKFPTVAEYPKELGRAYLNLATLNLQEKNYKEADRLFGQGEHVLGDLVKKAPEVPDYRHLLAMTYWNHAMTHRALKRKPEEEKAWNESIRLYTQLVKDAQTVPLYRAQLANCLGELGFSFTQINRLDKAAGNFQESVNLLEKLHTEFPREFNYVVQLIPQLINLATARNVIGGQPREVESCRRRVVELWQEITAAYPKDPASQSELAIARHVLAEFYLDRSRPAEARRELEKAVGEQQSALAAQNKNPAFRSALCKHYVILLKALCELEDHAAAARTAADLAQTADPKTQDWVGVAGFLGRCMELANQDKKLPEAKRREVVQAYGNQAIELLRRAVANGYKDSGSLKEAPEFELLRPRDDFKKLVSSLEDKNKVGAK
jgi:tetratricopeptide (TPR) repeat protein/tRNA A-37 threonylcarbamoyl transferase component Bud32